MTLRDDLLSVVQAARAIPAEFGLHRYEVTIRRRIWNGGAPGADGTFADVDRVVSPRPHVRQLNQREIADSGGMYTNGDWTIDLLIPDHATGGYTPEELKPLYLAENEEVVYILDGDEGRIECTIVDADFARPFRYKLVVRQTRRTP